jgi:small subunit ribosomal protein S1
MISNSPINYEIVLNKHNPKDKRSHSILRFFAEDLTDLEQIRFVEAIFDYDSWILSSEISKSSNSIKLRNYTENRFNKIFYKWVNKRIEHSSFLTKETKNPYLPQTYSLEFREILFTIRNLGFPKEIMKIFDLFIENCNPSYLKKYFDNNFWIVVEEYNTEEIETFFTYFSEKFIEKGSLNLSNFIYSFLSNFAYSPKIFNLSDNFNITLKELTINFKRESFQNRNYHLITVLLIELIEKKKLILSEPNYKLLINNNLKELEKGVPDNIDLFKFLKRFSYNFESFDFDIEIKQFFNKFIENIDKVLTAKIIFKKAIAHHYVKTSEKYFELFLFYLENVSEEIAIKTLIDFHEIIENLRKSFENLLWFNEYLKFGKVKGEVVKSIKGGYYIKIDDDLFLKKISEKNIDLNDDQDFISQNSFGFLNEYILKDYPDLKLLMQSSLNKSKNTKSIQKTENKIDFFIINVNYSSTNKGCVLILAPININSYETIINYKLKSLFLSFDLFLIARAHRYLNSKSPFEIKSFFLKNSFNNKVINDYSINISENSFWEILKKIKPYIYELTYININKELENFNTLLDAFKNENILKGTVLSITYGGLIIDVLGTKAFLPGSHIDVKTTTDFEKYIGKEIELKILKIDVESKSVIVSHRIILEPKFELQKQKIKDNLKKGSVLIGEVKNITTYGVFVDLDGVDGLIHITDISWYRINHPGEIVSLGQRIKVMILDYNDDMSKIQLGLKQLTPSPLQIFSKKYKIGSVLEGKVSQKVDYGIFVEIEKGVEGLVHISELSWSFNENIIDTITINDIVKIIILTLDIEENKLSFSIKRLFYDQWTNIENNYPLATKHKFIIKNIHNKRIKVKSGDNLIGYVKKGNLSWNRRGFNILDEFKINTEIELMVLDYNHIRKELILGYKQLFPNPWTNNNEKLHIGSVHEGMVININENGFNVKLTSGVVGFVFEDFSKKYKDHLQIGKNSFFKIKKIDPINQNLILKIL